jgi:hypothetical protein
MSHQDKEPRPVVDITITVDGLEHRGNWFTFGGMVYVRSPMGVKTTWVGEGYNAGPIAELLLLEIVGERGKRVRGK